MAEDWRGRDWLPAGLAAGSWRALCVIGVCLIFGCQTPSGNGRPMRRDSAAVRQCLEAHWEAIRNWRPETPYDEYDDKLEWWADVIMSSYEHMWLACYHVGPETALPFFVKQFGKHGDEIDFRLLMGGLHLLFPQRHDQPAEVWPQSNPAAKRGHQFARQAQLAAAKAQVEFFVRNPALLGRYYHALVWSQQFFGNPRYHFLSLQGKYYSLHRSFPKEPEGDYWWYAREFLVLAYATCREDLLEDAEPTELYDRFVKWQEWIVQHLHYALPHPARPGWGFSPQAALEERWESQAFKEPALPFPEWDVDVPPPPVGLIRDLNFEPMHMPYGIEELSKKHSACHSDR